MLIYVYSKKYHRTEVKNVAVRKSKAPTYRSMLICGLVFALAAIVMLYVGISRNNMRKRCTESTKGVVQSVKQERRSRKSGKHSWKTYYVYKTAYEFEADGKVYSGCSTLSEYQKLNEGYSLSVKYNPSKPDKEHYTQYDKDGTGGIAASVFTGAICVIFLVSGFKEKAKLGRSNGMDADLNGMNNTDKC